MQMAPRYVGVSPSEVVWENLGAGWWERKARVLGTTAFFAMMTLFWSVPNALVGTLSQLDYLSEKIPFLQIINRLPSFIVGAITGLLPPLLLSLLLEWVPAILGCMRCRVPAGCVVADGSAQGSFDCRANHRAQTSSSECRIGTSSFS